ncbi:copper homeostasis periplasmic binding protein CopC [Brucella anthropi]|uniref:copper homeostasis periplasmic binding protein CopC n=1 Tax=Brucella anthropi TaxID=529 RepID=UPI00077504ED|nr:copper homeostasis periplasmic binding protein CopC [Brucella anthropi]KXO72930.1 Cu resistance protein [Brucella anthropi]
MTRTSALLALGGLGCMLAAVPAFAHAHLKASNPGENATLASAPAAVTLDFTEELNLAFSGADIESASGAPVKHGDAVLSNGDQTLTVPLDGKLAAGEYNIKWHVLSTDGHKTEGSYSFTVNP